MTTTTKPLTFSDLTAIEPRLTALLAEAKAVSSRGKPHFCANCLWYKRDGLKAKLVRLVGWTAEQDNALLRSCTAYDLAYKTIYNALPDCRKCGCWR